MAIFIRVIRSNSAVVEEREFKVQMSTVSDTGPWDDISPWYDTRAMAEDRARDALRQATAATRRAAFTVLSSYSGETAK